MKFLDIPSLSHLSQALTYDSPECKVFTRLEAYSCKDVRRERKLRKEMEDVWKSEWESEELSISPEQKAGYLHSPFGLLSEKTSRNLHFLLVSTLNVAFPDYDFSSVRPDEFTRERGAGEVLKALSATVMLNSSGTSPRSYGSYPSGVTSPTPLHATLPGSASASTSSPPPHNLSQLTHPTLHRILNDAIALDECVVYSYVPSAEADPHAEDHDLEGAGELGDDDEALELVDDDDGAESDDGPGAGDAGDDDVMMMSMDEDDEDDGGLGRVPGEAPRRKRSHRRGLRDSYHARGGGGGRGTPPRSSEWESSFDESGPPTPGPNRYAPVRARGGLLWSANYFFHCKRQKRILFLSVWARKKTFGFSPHLGSTAYLPPPMVTQPASFQGHTSSSMPHLGGYLSHAKHNTGEGMPSLSGLAASISAGASYDHPIRIRGSPTPQPQTSTLTASAGGSPLAGAIPKLRRQRSASTASTRSTTTDVLNTLSTKAVKRVKV